MDLMQTLKHKKAELESEAREALMTLALEDWEQDRLQTMADEISKLEGKLSEAAAKAGHGRNVSDIYDDISIRLSLKSRR